MITDTALVSAAATGVLGEYDHAVEIPQGSGFTIIYGPNGVGKTKFLEIINELSNLRGFALAELPFKSATLKYSDDTELSAENLGVTGESDAETEDFASKVKFTLKYPNSKSIKWEYKEDNFHSYLQPRGRFKQIDDDHWQDRADGEILHIDELRTRFGKGSKARLVPRRDSAPEEAQSFVKHVPSFLIETQRLQIEENLNISVRRFDSLRESQRPQSRITKQANRIRGFLTEAQTEHSKITQRLDRTFPNRVLSAAAQENKLDSNSIRERYNTQNDFRSRLGRIVSLALEAELSLPSAELDDWALTLLKQYLDDADQKLLPFRDLLEKIELLEEIINGRLLNKQIRVTDGEGLEVTHALSNKEIALDSLSSGEQHEIILMIDLLFNVPAGAVVLIDEPEISLHVAWQIAFIPDVEKIAELAGFRFLVATHSPQIINDRWDRAVRLGPIESKFA